MTYGQMAPIEALKRLIIEYQKPEMIVAEVGCYDAATSLTYLPYIKHNNGHLYLIDWFCGNIGCERSGYHGYRPEESDDLYNYVYNIICKSGYKNNVTIINGKSQDVAKQLPDHIFDICFLDADHRYDGIKNDINTYIHKVKEGGILCGHDIEDINLANNFTTEDLNKDWLAAHEMRNLPIPINGGCHPGVIQAVYDTFGIDVEIWKDYGHHKIPIWVKKI